MAVSGQQLDEEARKEAEDKAKGVRKLVSKAALKRLAEKKKRAKR
jgi:hypothetical protein